MPRKKLSPATIAKDRKRTKKWWAERPLYSVWAAMMSRCFRSMDRCWKTYGGAGVTICPRWADRTKGYAAFVKDAGLRPFGASFGRFMDIGSYTCGVCRSCKKRGLKRNGSWQTPAEQGLNRRKRTQLRRLLEGNCDVVTGKRKATLSQAA